MDTRMEAKDPAFHHILVGVDGSEPACRAAELAARLARATGAELTLLAVARDAAQAPPEIERLMEREGAGDGQIPLLPADAATCLDVAAKAPRGAGVERPQRVIATGDATEMIADAARSRRADCIVLGRHRHGAARRLIMGSTAQELGRRIDVPILLVL